MPLSVLYYKKAMHHPKVILQVGAYREKVGTRYFRAISRVLIQK